MTLPDRNQKILLFADWFEPGYKAGGPIRSCVNFVRQMKDKYQLCVLTTDRDLNAEAPYEGVMTDKWTEFEPGIEIMYCSPKHLSWQFILQQVNNIQPDFIYLNSMYSRYFTIYPLLMRRLGYIRKPVVLSPRGMLRESALRFRKTKKKIFLGLLRSLGIPKLVRFHATDPTEQQDVYLHFGKKASVTLAPNFAGAVAPYAGAALKKEKQLSIIFVGRLHPIKNLDYLLELLPSISGDLKLTIVGSEEDIDFTARCKRMVAAYPKYIEVRFTGEIPNSQIPGLIQQHHIFALPTSGENFGHAIFESLALGRPVVISDQTPWRNLKAVKAGWDIDLAKRDEFIKALQTACDFNQQDYDEWSYAAWQHAANFAAQPDVKQLYYKLFQ